MASSSSVCYNVDDDEEERRRNNRLVMLDVDVVVDVDASSTTAVAATGGGVVKKAEEEAAASHPREGGSMRSTGELAKPCCCLFGLFCLSCFEENNKRNNKLLFPVGGGRRGGGNNNNNIFNNMKRHSWWTNNFFFSSLNNEDDHQGRNSNNKKDEQIHLFKYNEVPDFVKINPYILYGYRSLLPLHLCLKSIFIWSNETINIWSHLLGCLTFIVLLPYDNLYTIPAYSGTLSDHIVCSVSLICYQICMISSAGYHVFYCHSPQANVRWLAFDLSGIVVGLLGCYIPGVHYAFYCISGWENVYLFTIVVLSLIILTIQLNPKRLSDSIAFTISRVLMYTFLACYGIIPSAHWFYMNGGWKTEIVRVFIPKLIYMYMIGLGAIFFYLFHFPERLSPGYFDIVGASHQIWHVFIFFSLVWWRKSYLEVLQYRTSHHCK